MSAPAAQLRPTPRLVLDGQTLDCGLDADNPAVPVVLDGLTVSWGREDIWDEPDTTTLTITLYDRAGVWAGRIDEARAVGAPLALWATDTAAGFDHLVFHGAVSGVKAKPHKRSQPDAEWIVTLTVSDPTAGLGNATVQWNGDWPHETLQARAVKAAGVVQAATGIAELYFDPARVAARVAPWTPEGNARDLVQRLYDCTASSWTYVPHENVIRSVDRLRIPVRGLLTLTRVPADDGRHLLVVATAAGPYDAGSSTAPWPSATLAACWVAADDAELTQTKTQAITRVVTRWHNWANDNGREVHTRVEDQFPPTSDRNELVHESWLSDGRDVDPIILSTFNRATIEGRRALHPAITYDTRHTDGGFTDRAAATRCLTPAETNGLISVPGSPFADWLWSVPVFRPSGGRIAYRGGRWHITYTLQWPALDFTGVPDMFSYAALAAAGTRLTYDGPDTTLDPSLTYATLENVALPSNWTTIWK